MRSTPELDARAGLDEAGDLSVPDRDLGRRHGYPVSVAVEAAIDPRSRHAPRSRHRPGWPSRPTASVSLTGSHIRPQPGYGYDERRHVTVWGAVAGVRPRA